MNKNPNPQGKGLTPVLDSLYESQVIVAVPAKDIDQISSELFTSLFVLHSQFQFKPVIGASYWLYRKDNTFKLSLISPKEWGVHGVGQYVGECILQEDMTWTMNIDESAINDHLLVSMIECKRAEFEQALRETDNINEVLPFYLESLPFYQRVFASGLAGSLRTSMVKSGILNLTYPEAKKLLL